MTIADGARPFRQRYQLLQAQDGSSLDQDRRPGYVQLQEGDVRIQATLVPSSDGFEYTARWTRAGALLRGEYASAGENHLLATSYEGDGQAARADAPSIVRDPQLDDHAPGTALPRLRQWNPATRGECTLVETTGEPARSEEYFYLHNFDLAWAP